MNQKQIQQHIEKQIYVDALNGVGVQIPSDQLYEGMVIVSGGPQVFETYSWNQKKLWEMTNDELLSLYKAQCQARLLKRRGTVQ